MKQKHFQNLAFSLGTTSIIGQIVLMREMISVFYGNETIYAIILASWLFWVATGSFVMARILKKFERPKVFLFSFFIANFIFLPKTLLLVRLLKNIIHVPIGEIMGLMPMGLSSFLLLGPLSFVLGGIFTLLCRVAEEEKGQRGTVSVGTIYLWEAIGAGIGGFLYSFILIHYLSALTLTFFIGSLNLVCAFSLLDDKKRARWLSLILICAVLGIYGMGGFAALDQKTKDMQWSGLEVVATKDSIYGNIVLTKREGTFSLFENGLLSFSTKDDLSSEESVHYALLEHPKPRSVLLIGHGVAGGLREVLKHPVADVTYVELDPSVIELSRKYLPEEETLVLNDPRVKVIHTDGRRWVKISPQKYDVVIVSLGDPLTAMINRYFTLEFFEEVRRILTNSGILSLSVTSSENYLNDETREFLRSVNTTLRLVFSDVISVPGDTNIFITSRKSNVLTYDPKILIERLKQRRLKTKYVQEHYLPFKLSPDRVAYIKEALKEPGEINSDMRPIAYMFDIVLWSTHFNQKFKDLFQRMRGIQFAHLMSIPIILFVIGLFLRRKHNGWPIHLSIVTTGFCEVIFQVIVIIAFQTLYGYAYYKIGVIMASFMVGLALGSARARQLIQKADTRIFTVYKFTQCAIAAYPLLLPYLFTIFGSQATQQHSALFAGVFALLPIVAGFMGGLQYPLATHLIYNLRKDERVSVSRTAGSLYAADTFGAMGGAFLTGMILIPLLGIASVAYFCAAINISVFLLLVITHIHPARSSTVV